MTCLLDRVRAEYPHLGLAVYAFEPGGPLTLEVHGADGAVFTFQGRTLAAVIGRAFSGLEPDPPAPPEPEPPTNIFD